MEALTTYFAVVFVCLDNPLDKRRFMQFSQAKGYTTSEFLYIMPTFIADATAQPWVDTSDNPDGLDELTKTAYQRALIVGPHSPLRYQ